MKQVLQNFSSGTTKLHELPAPTAGPNEILIRTRASLISPSTERMLMNFGQANWIEKAWQQPDKVRMVLDKLGTDGLMATLDAVRSKLGNPFPLGYCNAGVVMGFGHGVVGISVGDRVVSNGKHAEVVSVPVNLCAKVPDSVPDDEAAFAVIAAIGLEGIRLVQPTLGEAVVVTGLGLIGLVTVQLLRAQGCRVLGVDLDPGRVALAQGFGAQGVDLSKGEDPIASAMSFSRSRGVDAVIITAATRSSEPVSHAARMCRKRGRIVLVGVTGLELSRADFYEKELSFQVSCSYGPGRYDPNYEDKGHDYPVGFVRWTAQRNFEAVLDMMADGRLDVAPLISHRFIIGEAEKAYELMAGSAPSLGILLEYPSKEGQSDSTLLERTVRLSPVTSRAPCGSPVVGFIGAGNYGGHVLIPAFARTSAILHTLATSGGVSGAHLGRRYGFQQASTDTVAMLADPAITTVVIATRHDTHARFVCEALTAGKHVFVEKPLCPTFEELQEIEAVYASRLTPHASPPLLMVGFNRRFAPQVQKIKMLLDGVREPKSFILTVNAGQIPKDHWTQDPTVGGGRILGEACHFVDLLRFLAGVPITGHSSIRMNAATADTASLQLGFADGSIGTIHYFANGDKSFPKERLEIFVGGRVLQLDNYRKLRGYGWPGFRKMNLWRQDKGQKACVAAFVDAIRTGGDAPIPADQIFEVSRVTIKISQTNS